MISRNESVCEQVDLLRKPSDESTHEKWVHPSKASTSKCRIPCRFTSKGLPSARRPAAFGCGARIFLDELGERARVRAPVSVDLESIADEDERRHSGDAVPGRDGLNLVRIDFNECCRRILGGERVGGGGRGGRSVKTELTGDQGERPGPDATDLTREFL